MRNVSLDYERETWNFQVRGYIFSVWLSEKLHQLNQKIQKLTSWVLVHRKYMDWTVLQHRRFVILRERVNQLWHAFLSFSFPVLVYFLVLWPKPTGERKGLILLTYITSDTWRKQGRNAAQEPGGKPKSRPWDEHRLLACSFYFKWE